MFNANELRAEMARHGYTQKETANCIGMSERTFGRKMKKGTFGLDEAEKIVKLFNIENPSAIFFAAE